MLLPSMPLVIVYLVGIIFSATKMRLHRKAAALAMAGFGALLLSILVHASGTLMTLPAYRGSLSLSELGVRLAVINLAGVVLTLAGTIILLLAIFADRDRKAAAAV
jgi:uncharacterized membrane protein